MQEFKKNTYIKKLKEFIHNMKNKIYLKKNLIICLIRVTFQYLINHP